MRLSNETMRRWWLDTWEVWWIHHSLCNSSWLVLAVALQLIARCLQTISDFVSKVSVVKQKRPKLETNGFCGRVASHWVLLHFVTHYGPLSPCSSAFWFFRSVNLEVHDLFVDICQQDASDLVTRPITSSLNISFNGILCLFIYHENPGTRNGNICLSWVASLASLFLCGKARVS